MKQKNFITIMMFLLISIFGMTSGWAGTNGGSLQGTAVAIPHGEGAIGFDDLNFSARLHKVLVPAGHTGKLFLIDPSTYAMTTIGGFSSSEENHKGHDVGISSADEGQGFIFVADHGTHKLDAVDIKTGTIVLDFRHFFWIKS